MVTRNINIRNIVSRLLLIILIFTWSILELVLDSTLSGKARWQPVGKRKWLAVSL